jgi:hypothetical protein
VRSMQGRVTNTHSATGGPTSITISGNGRQNVTLPNLPVITELQTRCNKFIASGGTSTDYVFNLGMELSVKQPISVQLTAASNPNILVPMDISNYCTDWVSQNSRRPWTFTAVRRQ